MKLKYIVPLAVAVAFIFSCSDSLIEKPKGFIAPDQFFNTEAEVESAIYGAYDFLHVTTITDNDHFLYSELGTDIGSGRVTPVREGLLDTWEPTGPGGRSIWFEHYQPLGAINMIIARVEASDNLPEEFKSRIIGEAKFLRAFIYYKLNIYWGNVPVWLDELDLAKVEQLPNSSSAEVRQQMINDLVDASNSLPTSVSQEGRATSWMAKGLLARVYLFDKQWQNARNMAMDIIDNSGHQLMATHKVLFDHQNRFNSELIHVLPKLADVKGSRIHSHSVPRPFDDGPLIRPVLEANPDLKIIRPDGVLVTDVNSRNPGGIFQGWGTFQCLKEHYDSHEEGDLRKDLIWHEVEFTDGSTFEMTGGGAAGSALRGRSGYYPLKWITFDHAPNNGSRDIHLQRLAELYLILAEAENELNGPTTVAYDAINTIRRRAFGDANHDLDGLSQQEFRTAIINENRWELANEGLRKWYLWHWGFDVFKAAVESVSSSLPNLNANIKPHHQYWRIPSNEIAKNPNLVQNPGY